MPHGALARTPHPAASTLGAAPPSRSLHLQIDGANRSCSSDGEQVCKDATPTDSPTSIPDLAHQFPVTDLKIPRSTWQGIQVRSAQSAGAISNPNGPRSGEFGEIPCIFPC